jgi:hypothetical protein
MGRKHDEFREEAERLKLLDKATQRQIIALYRDHAGKRTLPKRDREECMAKADALEKLLRLKLAKPS